MILPGVGEVSVSWTRCEAYQNAVAGAGGTRSMLGLSNILGKETIVGIDIGSRWMKVALAEVAGEDCWKITNIAVAPTPEGCVKDGNVIDKQAVAAALRELLYKANLGHATGAVAAISGAGVIVRHAKMPRITEASLRKSIRYELLKPTTNGS